MKATHPPTTTPASDPMRPSALLHGAASYLKIHGWTQHQFYDMVADTKGPFPPACTSGAIMSAATGRRLRLGFATDAGDEAGERNAAMRALRVFAAWIDLEYDPLSYSTSAIDVVGDWNDYDGRTRDEVIETLTDAATHWETIHHPGGAQ
ncbi:DUF6197 family protein [Actinoplanes sp. URMC 104]|uniref:DUF6197 family protein n=1 Tax=Actinoplanes sp. URMC 104 TaxID=3423409 RepID=UPI003F1BF0DD